MVDLNKGLDSSEVRQLIFWDAGNASAEGIHLACLATEGNSDVLITIEVSEKDGPNITSLPLLGGGGRLMESAVGIHWQSPEGIIFSISGESR